MKLQDYIHYYLGCKCWTYSGKGVLQSIDVENGHWYIGLDSGGGAVGNINDTFRECPEESKVAFPKGYPPRSILKPILRKLEDMTDEECLIVHKISPFWAEGTSEKYIMNRLYVIRERIIHLHLIPEIFHYLLKQGFDLFGLIDAGLALDYKTLNQNQ